MKIQAINKDEKNWSILFEQIVKGNVIPVIGPETGVRRTEEFYAISH